MSKDKTFLVEINEEQGQTLTKRCLERLGKQCLVPSFLIMNGSNKSFKSMVTDYNSICSFNIHSLQKKE